LEDIAEIIIDEKKAIINPKLFCKILKEKIFLQISRN